MNPVEKALRSLGGSAPEETVMAELISLACVRYYTVTQCRRCAVAAIDKAIEQDLVSRNFDNDNPNHATLSLT